MLSNNHTALDNSDYLTLIWRIPKSHQIHQNEPRHQKKKKKKKIKIDVNTKKEMYREREIKTYTDEYSSGVTREGFGYFSSMIWVMTSESGTHLSSLHLNTGTFPSGLIAKNLTSPPHSKKFTIVTRTHHKNHFFRTKKKSKEKRLAHQSGLLSRSINFNS